MPNAQERHPAARVVPVATRSAEAPGQWHFVVAIQNEGEEAFELLSAWLPHDHFRNEERELPGRPLVEPGGRAELTLPVRCSDEPGSEIENAFLILRARSRDRTWRIFARLRVTIQPGGVPAVVCERVSSQPVGFAG